MPCWTLTAGPDAVCADAAAEANGTAAAVSTSMPSRRRSVVTAEPSVTEGKHTASRPRGAARTLRRNTTRGAGSALDPSEVPLEQVVEVPVRLPEPVAKEGPGVGAHLARRERVVPRERAQVLVRNTQERLEL